MMLLTGQDLIRDVDDCQVAWGQCAFWWLGQLGFIVKLGKTVLYLDAYLSPGKSRVIAPLLKPEETTNAAVILGSHDHSDHIDRKSWPGMAKAAPGAKFVVPMLMRDRIVRDVGLPADRVLGADAGTKLTVGEVTISAIPAAHELLDTDPTTGLHPYLGYVLEGNGFCLYHSGDSCIFEGMQTRLRQWKLDLAFVPINGRDAARYASGCIGNMTYQEAVDLAGAVMPGMTVPAHYDMFANNSADPQLFLDYLHVKYPTLRARIPVHGQRTVILSDF